MKAHDPLLNVHKYKKDKYAAYFEILYDEGNDGFHYKVNFYDYATSKIVDKTEGKSSSLLDAKSAAQSWAVKQIEKFKRY